MVPDGGLRFVVETFTLCKDGDGRPERIKCVEESQFHVYRCLKVKDNDSIFFTDVELINTKTPKLLHQLWRWFCGLPKF